MLHTCRGVHGTSGAPILVGEAGKDMQIAGIQIAMFRDGGVTRMLAVPAEAIRRLGRKDDEVVPIASQCFAQGAIGIGLTDVQDRLGSDLLDIVSSIPNAPLPADTAWPSSEPFAVMAP
jgi:hypothetical protein